VNVRRGRQVATVLVSAALALGAVVAVAPAASASAGPQFMFVDATSHELRIGASDGTAAVSLSPSGIAVRSFAASDDGGTLALGTLSGPHRDLGYDQAAYALWVKDDAGVRSVSARWDTTPAVTALGDFVVWTTSNPAGASLFAYSRASHSTVQLCDGCISPTVGTHSDGYPIRIDAELAPSSSTTLRVAVATVSHTAAGLIAGTRVQVLDVATGGAHARTTVMDAAVAPATVTATTSFPGYELALSADGTTLLSTNDTRTTDPNSPWSPTGVAITKADLTAPSRALAPTGLVGYYGARELAGTWYLHHDTATTTETSTTNFSVTSLLATRVDGDHTFGYRPVSAASLAAVAPPAAQVAAAAFLDPSAATVRFGVRAGLDGYEYYGPSGSIPGLKPSDVVAALGSVYADGVLQASPNGATGWTGVSNRSGVIAGETWDHTLVPVRTQWYRWVFPGSANLAAKVSPRTRISVVAVVTAAKARRGAKTNVFGKTSRPSGTVVLQRLAGHRWVAAATAKITRTKTYAFGLRTLVKGSYRVLALGDTYQAAGVSARVSV
jgi:hypothetical protein